METGGRCCLESEERKAPKKGAWRQRGHLVPSPGLCQCPERLLAQEGLGRDVGRRAGKNRLVRQA